MNNIFKLINDSDSIVILTHESPDGDAMGSSLAMYNYLCNIGKNVDIVIPKYPMIFDKIFDLKNIITDSNKVYDLGIIVDCSTKERIGQNTSIFDNCKKTISIDHHISNTEFSDINYIKGNECSCSQVIYYLFNEKNITINKEIGSYLMCGVLTDTDGFKHNDVTKETFLLTADLMDLGVDVFNLYKNLLSTKTKAQYELSRLVMDRLEFFDNNRIAFSYINEEDMIKCGAVLGDHEGLVEIGRNISGVEVSIFLREENNRFKLSLRSNGLVDVNEVAHVLGGAGHVMAAGAVSDYTFKETKNIIINETIRILNERK